MAFHHRARTPIEVRRAERELFFWTARQTLKLVVLAAVAAYVVVSLVLAFVGIASFQSINQTVRTQDQKIEQLQVDTNDNLCNQSAYSAGNTCEGGDGNG